MDPSLWVAYPLAIAAMNAVWGGVMQVLLGKQIAAAMPDSAAQAETLGLALSLAAVSSLISQPVVGKLSDRTRTRFLGRRNAWIFAAGIVSSIGLVLMSQVTSTTSLAILWAMMVWPLNATQASLLAVLPERVPERVRGRMSGVIGAAGIIGAFAGVALAALSRDVFMGYLLIAGVFLLLTQAFAWTTRDRPPPDIATLNIAQLKTAGRVPTFREAPDYWWVFIGRFLLIFGYFCVASFQLFILRDYIGLSDIDEAARVLVAISGMSALLSIAFAVVGGWIADKVGRLRAFVAVSTFMFVPAGLVYLAAPTLTGVWIASGMSAAAFGVYLAVDQALIVRVLPPGDNAGRDLGIMNIANAGPQILAPSLAGAIVGATGNYQVVFIILIVCTALGAASTAFIKGAR